MSVTNEHARQICYQNGTDATDRPFAGEGARATESVTGKRRGEMAEAKFLAKASELGFGVAKPWGASDAYDFVQTGGRLWVQVKSAHVAWKWEL